MHCVDDLDVSRNTIKLTYQESITEGIVTGCKRCGLFVKAGV